MGEDATSYHASYNLDKTGEGNDGPTANMPDAVLNSLADQAGGDGHALLEAVQEWNARNSQ